MPPRRLHIASVAALALWPVESWACAPSPVLAVERYARAFSACDFVNAWPLLAEEERRAAGSLATWSQQSLDDASEELACRGSTSDAEVVEHGSDRATVRITLIEPAIAVEFRRVLSDQRRMLGMARITALNEGAAAALRRRILERDTWEPTVSSAYDFIVIREPTGWCVLDGIAEGARARAEVAERQRIQTARLAAENAQREQEREAKAALDAAARERGAAALPLVTTAAVTVGESTLRETGVFGEIVNGSRETLREVEIRIDFLDAAGLVVAEKRFPAILHSASARQQNDPLPPGQRRRFGVRADDAPSTWARRARVTVIRVEADPTIEPRDPPTSPPARQQPSGRPPQR